MERETTSWQTCQRSKKKLGEQAWGWIRKGYLKKRNWIRKNTDGQDLSEKYIECVGKEITSKNLENH